MNDSIWSLKLKNLETVHHSKTLQKIEISTLKKMLAKRRSSQGKLKPSQSHRSGTEAHLLVSLYLLKEDSDDGNVRKLHFLRRSLFLSIQRPRRETRDPQQRAL